MDLFFFFIEFVAASLRHWGGAIDCEGDKPFHKLFWILRQYSSVSVLLGSRHAGKFINCSVHGLFGRKILGRETAVMENG